jgi:hypothetical protein
MTVCHVGPGCRPAQEKEDRGSVSLALRHEAQDRRAWPSRDMPESYLSELGGLVTATSERYGRAESPLGFVNACRQPLPWWIMKVTA